MKAMKILVTGSRHFTDKSYMKESIESVGHVVCIIQGEARGADRCAKEIAKEMGVECKGYPAQWSKYGKAAGPIRNQEMLDKEHPDLVLAFPLEGSIGTWDMIGRCKKTGVDHMVFERDGA